MGRLPFHAQEVVTARAAAHPPLKSSISRYRSRFDTVRRRCRELPAVRAVIEVRVLDMRQGIAVAVLLRQQLAFALDTVMPEQLRGPAHKLFVGALGVVLHQPVHPVERRICSDALHLHVDPHFHVDRGVLVERLRGRRKVTETDPQIRGNVPHVVTPVAHPAGNCGRQLVGGARHIRLFALVPFPVNEVAVVNNRLKERPQLFDTVDIEGPDVIPLIRMIRTESTYCIRIVDEILQRHDLHADFVDNQSVQAWIRVGNIVDCVVVDPLFTPARLGYSQCGDGLLPDLPPALETRLVLRLQSSRA